jgi:hypothetical protein
MKLVEEEKARVSNEKYQNDSSYSAHAHALQTFVEKVTVFRAATNYKDRALVTGFRCQLIQSASPTSSTVSAATSLQSDQHIYLHGSAQCS